MRSKGMGNFSCSNKPFSWTLPGQLFSVELWACLRPETKYNWMKIFHKLLKRVGEMIVKKKIVELRLLFFHGVSERATTATVADTYTSSKKNEHFETGGFLFDIFIAHSTSSCGHFGASSAILVGIFLSRTVVSRWWHRVVFLLSTRQRPRTSSPTQLTPKQP